MSSIYTYKRSEDVFPKHQRYFYKFRTSSTNTAVRSILWLFPRHIFNVADLMIITIYIKSMDTSLFNDVEEKEMEEELQCIWWVELTGKGKPIWKPKLRNVYGLKLLSTKHWMFSQVIIIEHWILQIICRKTLMTSNVAKAEKERRNTHRWL